MSNYACLNYHSLKNNLLKLKKKKKRKKKVENNKNVILFLF